MEFTKEQLGQIIPGNPHVEEWYTALTESADGQPSIIEKYELNTPNRLAGFLAQCAHESAGFKFIKENLNYKWESLRRVFPKYFPTDELAQQYAHKPEKIANRVYGGRMGNGPEATGDGFKYCGRGLIQLTGHDNYSKFAESVGMTLDEVVTHLGTFKGAADSAGWFWDSRNLNACADADDIATMTKKINGGTIGLEDRKKHYEHAKEILAIKEEPKEGTDDVVAS
jgi:putative chitinase